MAKIKEKIKEKPEFLENPIQEYFKDQGLAQKNTHSELFKVKSDDVDVKTDLDMNRIIMINILHQNDVFLASKGIPPVYSSFIEKQMRLLISKDRKSRVEYVDVNKNKQDDVATTLGSAIMGVHPNRR